MSTAWAEIARAGGVPALRAFERLWFGDGLLNSEETAKLKALHLQFGLGEPNFKTWAKRKIRQLFEKEVKGLAVTSDPLDNKSLEEQWTPKQLLTL